MNLFMLSTSEKTSELSSSRTLESDSTPAKIKKKASMRLIIDDLSEINIIDNPHRQTLTDQKAVHFATFITAVFTTDIKFECEQVKCLHHNQLSLSSRHWKKMLDHSFKDEFLTAANKKYMNLECWNTFQHVSCFTASSKTLSLK